MDHAERMRRISTASEYVSRVTTQRWALAVMLDLKGVQKNKDVSSFVGTGLGLGYQLIGMDTGFVSLDTRAVVRAFKNSRCRLILLDYGGTIMADENVSRSCISALYLNVCISFSNLIAPLHLLHSLINFLDTAL